MRLWQTKDGQFVGPRQGGHRIDIRAPMQMELTSADTVLDLGAHIGSYTVYAAGIAKSVLAIEPHPDNYAILCENVAHLRNVQTQNVACYEGTEVLLHTRSTGGGHMHSVQKKRTHDGELLVQCRPITELLRGITKVKIDVEGAEYSYGQFWRDSDLRGIAIDFHRKQGAWQQEAWAICQAICDYGFTCQKWPTFTRFKSCGIFN